MFLKYISCLVVLLVLIRSSEASSRANFYGNSKALKTEPEKKVFKGLNFSPQLIKVPGDTTPYEFTCMNAEYTQKSLNALLPYTNRIRLFSAVCYEALVTILERSANEGFEVFMGLYGSGDQAAFENELNTFNAAYKQAQSLTGKNPVIYAVSVANEAILGNTMPVSQIKVYADLCRSQLQISPLPPIAVVDVPQVFDFYRQIFSYVDLIGVNIHPLYSGKCRSLESCLKHLDSVYKKLDLISAEEAEKGGFTKRAISIAETGFSYNTIISKDNVKVIPGGMTNQGGRAFVETYLNEFLSSFADYDYFWFEGIISDWKDVPEGQVELGWGLIDRYIFYTQIPVHPSGVPNPAYYASAEEAENKTFDAYSYLIPIDNSPENLFDFTQEDGGAQYFDPALYEANLFKPE